MTDTAQQLAAALGILERIEAACDKRAELLTADAYNAAITIPGMKEALLELDDARRDARTVIQDATLATSEKAEPLNQCDGCMQGAKLDGSLHRDKDGRAFMVCEAEKYTATPARPSEAREPLSDQQIEDGWQELLRTPRVPLPLFKHGVRFAERHHGILARVDSEGGK